MRPEVITSWDNGLLEAALWAVVKTEPEVKRTELGLEPLLLTCGDADREALLGVAGVPGGVTPFPLARLSPMTFTSSLTDTPINSGGMSLFAAAATMGFLEVGGLCEAVRLMASLLNSFWKKLGFLQRRSEVKQFIY